MAQQFYSLKVAGISKTTDQCSIISFEVKDQYKDLFNFKQGQYLTLRANINGQEVRRSYSLCSSPLDEEWSVAIKEIEGGQFSTFANNELRVGDTIEVMPPNGRFFKQVEPEAANNYIGFAAGSGITPIYSIIKTHLLQEPKSTFTLFYINQYVQSIILREEIEDLKNLFMERFQVFYFLTQEDRVVDWLNGRLDSQKLDWLYDKLVDLKSISDVFVCGPEAMIFMVQNDLLERNFPKENIRFELFSSGQNKKRQQFEKQAIDPTKLSEIVVTEGGITSKYKVPQRSNSILDIALQNGVDLPFACKGGVCCTCRAKLLEGKVNMEINYALEQDELDAGYILTCQAIPTSEKVVVSFDE